jgi:hypothetical protein
VELEKKKGSLQLHRHSLPALEKGGKLSSKRSKEAREIYRNISWYESIPRCSRPASSIKLVRRILEALQPVTQQLFEKRTRRTADHMYRF